MKPPVLLSTLFLLGLASLGSASTLVTYGAPGEENTTVAGATTYSFDNFSHGYNTASAEIAGLGQFTGLGIENAGEYGGATGHSHYGVVGYMGNSSADLTFSAPASYVGFWWSAADAENVVTLYSGNDAVLTLSGTDLVKALGACTSDNPYCGNPNNGMDKNELFTYVNIFGQNGTQFSKVSFQNGPDTGFEFDNLAYIDPPAVPEPATWSCLALGLGGLSLLRWRKRAV